MKIEYPLTRLAGLIVGSGAVFGIMWLYANAIERPVAYAWVTINLFYFLTFCFLILHYAPRLMDGTEKNPYRWGFTSPREGWAQLSVATGGIATLVAVLFVGAFFPRLLM